MELLLPLMLPLSIWDPFIAFGSAIMQPLYWVVSGILVMFHAVWSPLLGAEVRMEPGAELTLELDPGFEHGLLLDRGTLSVNGGCLLPVSHLLHEAPGPTSMALAAG